MALTSILKAHKNVYVLITRLFDIKNLRKQNNNLPNKRHLSQTIRNFNILSVVMIIFINTNQFNILLERAQQRRDPNYNNINYNNISIYHVTLITLMCNKYHI